MGYEMVNFRSVIVAAVIATGVIAAPASAALKLFRLFGDANALFTLSANPTPSAFSGGRFDINNVAAILNGNSGAHDLSFFTSDSGGGFDIVNALDTDILVQVSGPQLFTGPTSAPVFVNGTYSLVDYLSQQGSYTLVVSEVPEPGNWAMLIVGFGLSGAALRRRRHRATPVAATVA